MFKVLVCGSRHFTHSERVSQVLDRILEQKGRELLIISGGATGADELARRWAVSRKVDHHIMYAQWELDGRAAGPIRNRRMLAEEPDAVIAFKVPIVGENRGTENMIKISREAGVKIWEFI